MPKDKEMDQDKSLTRVNSQMLYETQATVGQLQRDLSVMRVQARNSITARQIFISLGIVGLVATGVGVLFPLIWILSIPLAAVSGVLILAFPHYSERRIETWAGVLRWVSRDMGREEPLHVRLDLRSPTHHSKQVGTGTKGPWRVRRYDDLWLRVHGRFVDGATWRLSLGDRTELRQKRCGSRNHKTKHKNRTASLCRLSLKAHPKRYRVAEAANRLPTVIRLPQRAFVTGLGNDERYLWVKTSTHLSLTPPADEGLRGRQAAQADVDLAMSLFLSVYQALFGARVAAR